MFFNVPTLCMLSIKTLSVGSTVFVNQMVPHTSTSSCVIDLKNQSMQCPHARKPACSHPLKAIKKKLKSGKSSRDVYVETRQEAGGLSACKVSVDCVWSIRFTKLRNGQFTTKAVPTLQDPVKKTNSIL